MTRRCFKTRFLREIPQPRRLSQTVILDRLARHVAQAPSPVGVETASRIIFAALILLLAIVGIGPASADDSGRQAKAQAPIQPAFEEMSTGLPSGHFAAVDMGDINQDGYAEIVSGRWNKEKGLFLCSYDGKQWGKQQISDGGEYGGVAIADINGDKILDVLAATKQPGPAGLEIHLASLSAGEMRFTRLPSPLKGVACDDVAVGDIESDGDMDIAVSTCGKGVQVLVNDGNASFRQIGLATGTGEDTGIAFGDVNHDGRLDIVASNHPGENLRLFLCSAKGAVSYEGPHTEGLGVSGGIGYRIVVADFNGDRLNDMAVGTGSHLRFFLGTGCKGDAADWWRESSFPRHGNQVMQVAADDLNHDGKPDLSFACNSGVSVFLNQGTGEFSKLSSAGLPDKGEYSGCCLFDWDGDGDLDLACSGLYGPGVHFYRNVAIEK